MTSDAYESMGTQYVYNSLIITCSFGLRIEEMIELADLRNEERSLLAEKSISLPLCNEQPRYFHSETISIGSLLRVSAVGLRVWCSLPKIIALVFVALKVSKNSLQ